MILLLSLYTNIFSQDYWLRVPSPTPQSLTRGFFVDSVYGWAAGDSGTIISTTNGGLNWNVQNTGIKNYFIDDVFFLNPTTGWALSNDYLFNGTFVLKTTSGGAEWSISHFTDTTVIISTIYFTDPLNGYTSGFSGKMFKTSNGGVNWNECMLDTTGCPYLAGFPKLRIKFINSTTGYTCGGQYDIQGVIWKTTDAGLSWQTHCVTPEPLFDIRILNSGNIIACGGDFEFGAITTSSFDNAFSWDYHNTGIFGVAKDLAFRTDREVWMPLAFAQTWAVNIDINNPEEHWRVVPAPDTTAVYSAVFKSQTFGYAFGTNGAIMKYNTAIIGITPGGSIIPSSNSLEQNYPNPFNPSTIINYKLAKAEFVKISLYDITGKLIKVFIEGNRPTGFNRFRFENFGLASGVYIYKIDAGSFSESKKMLLIK
ncbi:MAG: T9SS type A sorting domain-containing protein [Ignavibacteria bacterium]